MTDSNVSEIEEAVSSITSSLLERAQTGQNEAWDRLVDLYSLLVYGWCRRQGLDADESRDVGQEVFVAVSKSLERFHRDEDVDTFLGWLRTITTNKIRDHWRREKGRPKANGGSDATAALDWAPRDPLESSDAPEYNALFLQILEYAQHNINPQHWEIFWRVAVGGQAAADIAAEMGVQPHSVYNIKSRTLKRLREIYAENIDAKK